MAVDVSGHRARMRSRAKFVVPEEMRAQDLLELILYYALPRRDTKEMAGGLLDRFGTLEGVLAADPSELTQVSGIGANAAKWLTILNEAVQAYSQTEQSDLKSVAMFSAAKEHLAGLITGDEVCQLCVSAGGRLLSSAVISDTADWGGESAMRSALNEALITRAHGVIIGRRGDMFTERDIYCTRSYARTLLEAEVFLIDCILITPDGGLSLRVNRPEIWQ